MEAIIASYRRGKSTQYNRQMILEIPGINKEKAEKLIGKKVIWRSPKGKEIEGIISALHGNKGRVRARFGKGLPGQALGTRAEIV